MRSIALILALLCCFISYGQYEHYNQEQHSIVLPDIEYYTPKDHTDTYTLVTSYNSAAGLNNETGFSATVTLKYAFKRCFGDIVMVYGYDISDLIFHYQNKEYTGYELGIYNLEEYITSVELSFMLGRCDVAYLDDLVQGYNNSVIRNFDVGCYGQTFTIPSSHPHFHHFDTHFNDACIASYKEVYWKFNYNMTLVYKIENLVAEREVQKEIEVQEEIKKEERTNSYWNETPLEESNKKVIEEKSYWD